MSSEVWLRADPSSSGPGRSSHRLLQMNGGDDSERIGDGPSPQSTRADDDLITCNSGASTHGRMIPIIERRHRSSSRVHDERESSEENHVASVVKQRSRRTVCKGVGHGVPTQESGFLCRDEAERWKAGESAIPHTSRLAVKFQMRNSNRREQRCYTSLRMSTRHETLLGC